MVDDGACSVLFCSGNSVKFTNSTRNSRLKALRVRSAGHFFSEVPGECGEADFIQNFYSHTGGNAREIFVWAFFSRNRSRKIQFLGPGLGTLEMAYEQHPTLVR